MWLPYRGIVPSSGVSRSMSRPVGSQEHGGVVGGVSAVVATVFRWEVGVGAVVVVAVVGTGIRAARGRVVVVDSRRQRRRDGSETRILVG